jgi:pimeloyl-ACP methyl ester carboxylesterase
MMKKRNRLGQNTRFRRRRDRHRRKFDSTRSHLRQYSGESELVTTPEPKISAPENPIVSLEKLPEAAPEPLTETTVSSDVAVNESEIMPDSSNPPLTSVQSPIPQAQTDSYTFRNYQCAYDVYCSESTQTPLLLIHPIGVGLSRHFWQRFCQEWYATGQQNPIYNPDLLGCGDSDAPPVAYYPEDWAAQLQKLITKVIKKPVIVVVQGALFPVALELVEIAADSVEAIVASGPPAWELITNPTTSSRQKALWNLLFDTPLGRAFYRYARRRQFLQSFSVRQLFASEDAVDEEWLKMLKIGAADVKTRYAVFSFLAGFWRKDYGDAIASLQQPTLVLFGEGASSISRKGASETPQERLAAYLDHLPHGEGYLVPGRNVMPYESPQSFVAATAAFIRNSDA